MDKLLSVVRPKEPSNSEWRHLGTIPYHEFANARYIHKGLKLLAISAVEVVDGKPEYHLSISRYTDGGGRRCTSGEALVVLNHFDLLGAVEDNHSPTIRNFWMPVAEINQGIECECKDDEAVIVEGDFEWRPLTQGNADRGKQN